METVWERGGGRDTIGRRAFLGIMGLTTVAGLLLTAYCAQFTTGWLLRGPEGVHWVGQVNIWVFFIGILVLSLVGTVIALSSDNPIISIIGYVMVAVPFGWLLGPTVGLYNPALVTKVIYMTATVTIALSLLGILIPQSLESWGGWLFGALCVLLVGTIGIPFLGWLIPGFPVQGALAFWDWVGVIIFSGYIVFDTNRAMHVPATIDNAIDCSLALYLDIINLFIRLLEIMARSED